MPTATVTDVATTVRTIRDELCTQFLERREAVEGTLLAVLAKEHAFILGPPGTSKSLLARELTARFTGSTFFEVLLSKTRPDAAVLGPYDLPLMQHTGEFHRRIQGTLLTADIAFLDEIGKMSPTLGHELLAALNERVRHEVREDGSVHAIPLSTAITASNELPAGESEDAAALWDRLLVRVQVDYLRSQGNFVELLRRRVRGYAGVANPTTLPWTELCDVIDEEIPAIEVPDSVLDLTWSLRSKLAAEHIVASDRRWAQSMRLLQARAWLEGRDAATEDDLAVLDHVLWQTPDQLPTVRKMRAEVSDPLAKEAMQLLDDLKAIDLGVESRRSKSLEERAGHGVTVAGKVNTIERAGRKLAAAYEKAGKSTAPAIEVLDAAKAVNDKIRKVCLEVPDDLSGLGELEG